MLMSLCICMTVFASYDTGGEPSRGKSLDVIAQRGSRGVNSFKITSLRERFERFDEFIVYVKGGRTTFHREGKAGDEDRILVCSVVLQLCRGMKLTKDRVLLRKVIYEMLQGPPGICKVGEQQKEKLKGRLNAFMGDAIVKKVYFTKFVLL